MPVKQLPELLRDRRVQETLAWLRQQAPAIRDLQVQFAKLPSPDMRAPRRAALFKERLQQLELEDVHIDVVGNVLGTLRGTRRDAPMLVLSAHLDSVFPHLETIPIEQEGSVLRGPGIADDAAGLAGVVFLMEALQHAGRQPECHVVAVATVGEEGEGDLAGIKHLFGTTWDSSSIAAFLTLDLGGQQHAAHVALGSRRLQVTARGPGGHSWGDFGRPNPIHALGRGTALFLEGRPEQGGRRSWNVGHIVGGNSVNAIPEHAELRVDLRGIEPSDLEDLESQFREAMMRGAQLERDASSQAADELQLRIDLIGDRPTGETALDSSVVQVLAAAFAARELPLKFIRSSTDANVPMSLGVPALALPHGVRAYNTHSEREWCDVRGREAVLEAEFLAILALAATS